MQIQKGTVWHTYTTQSPAYEDAEEAASKLIETGVFLAILTPNNTFKCLSNGNVLSTKLSMEYENNAHGVTVEGGQEIHKAGVCALTANAFFNCINIRLSENKLFYTGDQTYCNNIICCAKPMLLKNKEDEFFFLPIVRLYKNGISHITFIDEDRYNNELDEFIQRKVNLPYHKNDSVIASIEYTTASINLDFSTMSFFNRLKSKLSYKHQIKELQSKTEKINLDDSLIEGNYIDYAKEFQIENNLSEIARNTIAIVHNALKKRTINDFVFGSNLSDFYHGWQGKPNIYVFEHENQKFSASKNQKYNKKLISALLGKNSSFLDEKNNKQHVDFRTFDDFNHYSEQGVTLTLFSKKINSDIYPKTYTESNLIWDNQIQSELTDFVSFFYESKIEEIKNEPNHIGLATIQEDIIKFEEWLRVFSKKYGEVQELTLENLKSSDLTQKRKNLTRMLRSRMKVIKLKDANKSENSNRNITIAFGLVASTSLSPVIIKPFFESTGLLNTLKNYNLGNYQETIYYISAVFFVLTMLWLINRLNKK